MNQSSPTDGSDQQDLQNLFQPIEREKHQRIAKVTQLKMINIEKNAGDPRNRIFWAPDTSDSFTLFLSKKGSGKLDKLHQAWADQEAAQDLVSEMASKFKKLQGTKIEKAIQQLLQEPVFAEFQYAGHTLAQHLYLPDDLDLIALMFPYEGGRLPLDAFTLIQWCKEGTKDELEGLVVHREPALTEAERAAELNSTGPATTTVSALPRTAGIVGTYVAGAAAAAWAAALAGPVPSAFDVADLGDEVLRNLREAPGIDDLIELRRTILPENTW